MGPGLNRFRVSGTSRNNWRRRTGRGMRRRFLRACAPLGLLSLLWVGAPSARAAVIYDAQDSNAVGELVPNADDGTPGRPPGSRMGNTVIFAGTERALDTVMLQYGTYHPDGQPSPTQ